MYKNTVKLNHNILEAKCSNYKIHKLDTYTFSYGTYFCHRSQFTRNLLFLLLYKHKHNFVIWRPLK